MNNKNSRLKKLILGSTMLTAFAGFTAEVSAVITPGAAGANVTVATEGAVYAAAAGADLIDSGNGGNNLTGGGANVAGPVHYIDSNVSKLTIHDDAIGAALVRGIWSRLQGGTEVTLGRDNQADPATGFLEVLLSKKNPLAFKRNTGYTGAVELRFNVSTDATTAANTPVDFTPAGNLEATLAGGHTGLSLGNGLVTLSGGLDATKAHTFKILNGDEAGTTKATAASYYNFSTINAANVPASLAKLTVESSGAGAHRYFMHDANLAIEGITVAEGAGPVVYATNTTVNRALTVTKFNVSDDSSGVMTKDDANANERYSLVVNTVKGDATNNAITSLTLASASGTLSGKNIDVDNAKFTLRGEATLAAAVNGTGVVDNAPVITVKMENRKYSHIDAYNNANGNVVAQSGVYDMKMDALNGNTLYMNAKAANGDANKIDVAGAVYVNGVATDKAATAKLNFATPGQRVIIEGSGVIDFANQNNVVAELQSSSLSDSPKENAFTFQNTVAAANAATIKLTGNDGVGAHKLTYSTDAANAAGKIEVDQTAGDVELYRDPNSTGEILGLSVSKNSKGASSVKLTGGVHKASGALTVSRDFHLKAPLLTSNANAAVITLNTSATLDKPILVDDAQAASTVTFDGGADFSNKYFINTSSYKGTTLQVGNYPTAYNNLLIENSKINKDALIAAKNVLEGLLPDAARNAGANFVLGDSAATYTATNNPNFVFAKDTTFHARIDGKSKVSLEENSVYHGGFANSAETVLTMKPGAELHLYPENANAGTGAILKSIRLVKGEGSKSNLVKFVQASTGPGYTTLDFNNNVEYLFDHDGALKLDVSDVHIAANANGTMTFRNKFKVVNANKASDAADAKIVQNSGSVILQNRIENDKDADDKEIMRADTAIKPHIIAFGANAADTSFGSKDAVLKSFAIDSEANQTVSMNGADHKLNIYADEVSLKASYNDINKDFILSTGTFNVNTSKFSLDAKDDKLNLGANTNLVVNPLAAEGLEFGFKVSGVNNTSTLVFGDKGAIKLTKNATEFNIDNVRFDGGLILDGAKTFNATEAANHNNAANVNVQKSFEVRKESTLGLGDYSGSDVSMVAISAPITLTDVQASDLIFVNAVRGDGTKAAKNQIMISADALMNVTGNQVTAGMLNDVAFSWNEAGKKSFSGKGSSTTILKATAFEDKVNVETLNKAFRRLDKSRSYLTFSINDKNLDAVYGIELPTEGNILLAEGTAAGGIARAIVSSANKALISQDSLVYKFIESEDDDAKLSKGLQAALDPNAKQALSAVTGSVSLVKALVANRLNSIVTAAASGDFEQPKLGFWAQGLYGAAEQKPYDSNVGYDVSSRGGAVGGDFTINDYHMMGMSIGYVSQTSEFKDAKNKNEYSTTVFNQYSLHDLTESIYLKQLLSVAKTSSKENRIKLLDQENTSAIEYDATYGAFGLYLGNSVKLADSVIFTHELGARAQLMSSYEYEDKELKTNTKVSSSGGVVLEGALGFAYPIQSEDYLISPLVRGGFEYDLSPNKGAFVFSLDQLKYTHNGDNDVQSTSTYADFGADVKYDMFEVSPRVRFDFRKEYVGCTGALKVRVEL